MSRHECAAKLDEMKYCDNRKNDVRRENLNLIERLWKFVKKEVLYSIYYDNFEKFTTAIMECLSQTETKHKKALDSLLTLKFQTFTQSSI